MVPALVLPESKVQIAACDAFYLSEDFKGVVNEANLTLYDQTKLVATFESISGPIYKVAMLKNNIFVSTKQELLVLVLKSAKLSVEQVVPNSAYPVTCFLPLSKDTFLVDGHSKPRVLSKQKPRSSAYCRPCRGFEEPGEKWVLEEVPPTSYLSSLFYQSGQATVVFLSKIGSDVLVVTTQDIKLVDSNEFKPKATILVADLAQKISQKVGGNLTAKQVMEH